MSARLIALVGFASFIALAPNRIDAQTGRIVGTVTDASGAPLAGVTILVPALAITAVSRTNGAFTIPDVPAGSYDLRAYRIGYNAFTIATVAVRSGEDARVAARLTAATVVLDAIVISVSRRAESITEAPAAVTHFDAGTIENALGSPVTTLLKQAPGIDVTQVGVMTSFVNGRGFNKAFNSRWLTIEDGRVATFPETGLPIGEHTTIPKLDLAGFEVIAGPGSAMYGANASGGVLSVTTKDPRQFPGASIELSGGTQSYRDVQARYAGSLGKWGFKISGQYQSARDWLDTVRYASTAPGGPALLEAARPLDTRATRIAGSVRYYLNDDGSHVALNSGTSLRDALGQSAQGRYQIDGYRYSDYQLLLKTSHWFAQAYTTRSNSGDAYRLSSLTYTKAAAPGLSTDSARALSLFPVDGRIEAVEVQNNERIGALVRSGLSVIDNSRLTWGLQARRDRVSSDGKLYTDALSGEPITTDQRAFYAQIESRPVSSLRVVGAARYDWYSRYPSRWSPKIGLMYDVARDNVLRLTYNGAYAPPSIFQSDVYVLSAPAHFALVGNVSGFDIRNSAGATVSTVARLRPETNETWELGFKGKLDPHLFVDATVYRARFRDFITQVGFLSDPFAATPTFAYDNRNGHRVEDAQGHPVRLFTTVNVGEGLFDGVDASLRYYLNDRVFLSGATSVSHVIAIHKRPTDPAEATAYNASLNRSSIGADYVNPQTHLAFGLRTRYVQGYDFQSGVHNGHVPTFGTLSATASYRITAANTSVFLQADNIAACVSGSVAAPAAGIGPATRSTYTRHQVCGAGLRHYEVLNMPAMGTMMFLGLRREWR